MLEIEELHVRYGPVAAVRGLTLSCAAGQIVSLIGPNGAGKTSTLLAITGSLPRGAVSGTLRLEGETIAGLAPERIVRRGLVLVPEGRRIFGQLSVEDNLILGATVRRDKAGVARDLDAMLERFPVLGRKRHGHAGQLSGGEQQQLAIARALLSRPKLVMLDEPSLGLAPLVVDEVFDVIETLARDGTAVVLVEQNALRALEISDHCHVLRNGRFELSGPSRQLREDEGFLAAYFGAGVADGALHR